MEYIVKNRNPQRLFEIFEEICAIPHGSGNEAAIAAYIENAAKKRGLFCIRDEANNVFVRVDATEGRENEDAILLQGHTDMVCEKNSDTEHDFETAMAIGVECFLVEGGHQPRKTLEATGARIFANAQAACFEITQKEL